MAKTSEKKALTPEEEKKHENTDTVLAKMDAIEKLLIAQREENQHARKQRRFSNIMVLCLMLTFAIGFIALAIMMSIAVQSITEISNEIRQSLKHIDYETLNNAIQEMEKGLKSIDFESLNKSIQNLRKAVESLSNFLKVFK